LVFLVSLSACGEQNVCQQASDKVLTCMRNLDCGQFTDADAKADCEAQKAAAMGESGSMAGQSCSGDLKTRADQINRCTLDQARLCSACTTETADPNAAPPSNGAKLFDWNACHSGSGDDWTGNTISTSCMHQWGSFPAACTKLKDTKYSSGKKCKNVCKTGDCTNGCYNKYNVGLSLNYLASTYTCSN
jgi:hypothetical protein